MIKSVVLLIVCCCFSIHLLATNASPESENTKTKQKKVISFIVSGLTPKEIVAKVIKEVKKPYKVKESATGAGTLVLSKGISMTSWGEKFIPLQLKKSLTRNAG